LHAIIQRWSKLGHTTIGAIKTISPLGKKKEINAHINNNKL
jgi:hypothetical protein